MVYLGLIIIVVILLLGLSYSLIKKRDYIFFYLIVALFVSQIFILIPGSYANYDDGSVRFYSIFSTSLSTIVSTILILYLLISLVFSSKRIRYSRAEILLLFFFIASSFISFLGQQSFTNKLATFMKILLPIELLLYLPRCNYNIKSYRKVIYIINLFLISQTLVCKALTGKFAASIFYTSLENEFFGFYNSPHPLAATLCFLSIFLLIEFVNYKNRKLFTIFLFACNQIFIYLLGTTSYLVADILGLAVLIVFSTMKGNEAIRYWIRKFLPVFLIAVPVVVVALFNSRIVDNLLVGNITNGRLNRWMFDLNIFINNAGLKTVLFGDGFYSIFATNLLIGQGEINSLNFFIDMLFDTGLFGLLSYCFLYIYYFKNLYTRKNNAFFWQIIAVFLFSAFFNNLVPYVTVMTIMIILLNYQKNMGEREYGFKRQVKHISTLSAGISSY